MERQGVLDSQTPTNGLYKESEWMRHGVLDSQTPTNGCIRSPDGETRSLRLTDSYQWMYKGSGWRDKES